MESNATRWRRFSHRWQCYRRRSVTTVALAASAAVTRGWSWGWARGRLTAAMPIVGIPGRRSATVPVGCVTLAVADLLDRVDEAVSLRVTTAIRFQDRQRVRESRRVARRGHVGADGSDGARAGICRGPRVAIRRPCGTGAAGTILRASPATSRSSSGAGVAATITWSSSMRTA